MLFGIVNQEKKPSYMSCRPRDPVRVCILGVSGEENSSVNVEMRVPSNPVTRRFLHVPPLGRQAILEPEDLCRYVPRNRRVEQRLDHLLVRLDLAALDLDLQLGILLGPPMKGHPADLPKVGELLQREPTASQDVRLIQHDLPEHGLPAAAGLLEVGSLGPAERLFRCKLFGFLSLDGGVFHAQSLPPGSFQPLG